MGGSRIIDRTHEESGKGYQILSAMMPRSDIAKNNRINFWDALTNNTKGFEKWVNVFMNGASIILIFIIALAIFVCLIVFVYQLIRFFL